MENVAELLGIDASNINFTPSEIIKGFINMRNGAICEASRIYEQNYAQFNLPRQVQVALMEDIIRLQNVTYLLETQKHKNKSLKGKI